MPTLDDITLEIYNEMKIAARDGDLLGYASKLARSMANSRIPDELRREPNRVSPRNIEDQPTPQSRRPLFPEHSPPQNRDEAIARVDNSATGRQIPAPVREQIGREENDNVRVFNG